MHRTAQLLKDDRTKFWLEWFCANLSVDLLCLLLEFLLFRGVGVFK